MIPILSNEQALAKIKAGTVSRPYSAMFSSLWSGIVKDPNLMLIPIDDHIVHRGDGVFEALKFTHGKVYLMQAHLERLMSSAERIGLKPYGSIAELKNIIEQTIKASEKSDGLIRVFMSRGPGSFTANPYDTIGTQFFVIITPLMTPSKEKFENGVSVGRSQIAVKEGWMAQVKSCNYLPNVLMKKEAVDLGYDFTVSFDSENFLCESSTENIAIVDERGFLVKPNLRKILRGTTMTRAFDLATELFPKGLIKGIESRDISENDMLKAKEIMMLGTTLDVLPVTSFERKQVGDGKVGPVARELLGLLQRDQN